MCVERKSALITGAARGIGFAIAKRLASDGFRVCLWDKNPEVEDSARSLRLEGLDVISDIVDVTNEAEVVRAISFVNLHWGGLSILINNAGVNGPTKPTEMYTLEEWENVIRVNLLSAFICVRASIPLLRKFGSGRIVNIASIAGKEGNANISAYSSAKAGLIAFTKSLAKELIGDDIFVHAIAPAMIETSLLEEMSEDYIDAIKAKIPMGRLGQPNEVAAAVAWLCSSECSFSTGAVMDLSGGRATY